MKKIVLLDLDNTLFDSSSYRKKLFYNIAQLLKDGEVKNIEKLCRDIYDGLRSRLGIFSPKEFVEELIKKTKVKKSQKSKIFSLIFSRKSLSNNMYSEVSDFLTQAAKLGEVGILSQGVDEIQRAKLSEISHYFHNKHIHIVARKHKITLEEVLSKYKHDRTVFIDDSLPVLYDAKKIKPDIKVIWIKRGRYAENQKDIEGFSPDLVILNLKEALPMISSL